MHELNEFEPLFDSKTIKPTFDYVHIILAFFLFGENPEGIGRYRLEKELLIGSGTAKSLVRRLKENGNYIQVPIKRIEDTESKMKGHILTENGIKMFAKLKKKFPILQSADAAILKEIIIDPASSSYFCLVKNAESKIKDGISQRDAAIRVSGSGATCLVYDGKNLVFPEEYASEKGITDEAVQLYFKTKFINSNVKLERGDAIIIGLGDNAKKARLAALNAALSLLN